MSPKQYSNLLQKLAGSVPTIRKVWTVVDDSMLVNSLAEVMKEDNILLIGAMPTFGTTGRNADSWNSTTLGLIFILEKTDYSDHDNESFIDLFDRTYQAADAVRRELLNRASCGCCPELGGLVLESLRLEPEWRKGGCNGWSLEFEIG